MNPTVAYLVLALVCLYWLKEKSKHKTQDELMTDFAVATLGGVVVSIIPELNKSATGGSYDSY